MLNIRKIFLLVITSFIAETANFSGAKKDANSFSHPSDIVKRRLNWTNKTYIVSISSTAMKVDYLQPHSRNVKVLEDRNYMGFNLYKRNGQEEIPNTGVFHFIDTDIAEKQLSYCSRKTRHAGAYRYFYDRCPEDDKNIVASGYCYQGLNKSGFIYHSFTFNRATMTYLDGSYYIDETREVNEDEVKIIQYCFNSWKNSGFPVDSWKCDTAGIPEKVKRSSLKSRMKRFLGCSGCECGVSGMRPLQTTCFTVIFVCVNLFHFLFA